jgi:hypothetical protein
MTLIVKQVIPPDDLVTIYMKQDSGKLPDSMLVNIGPSGNLHHDAARSYRALAFMCMAIDLPLTYTYGGCYRSYQSQVTLFLQRYSPTYLAGRPTKVWQGKTYWQKPNTAMAAVPGTSNHGWGIAVDFAFDSNPTDGIGPDDAASISSHPQWPTFQKYALDCGWSWEAQSEPWHLRLVTGSIPTQTVLNAEKVMYPTPNPPAPTPNPTPTPLPEEDDDDMAEKYVFVAKNNGEQYLWIPGRGAPQPFASPADRDLILGKLDLLNTDGSPKPGITVSDAQFATLR